MKTEMSIESVLLNVCFTRNRVFITDEGVSSLYFTLKSQEVWKSDFSAANLCFNQYSLSNHLRERDWCTAGNSCREKGRELGEKQSIQRCRSECGSRKLGVNTEWRTAKEHSELTTMRQRWWHRDGERERGMIELKVGIFSNPCPCVCIF